MEKRFRERLPAAIVTILVMVIAFIIDPSGKLLDTLMSYIDIIIAFIGKYFVYVLVGIPLLLLAMAGVIWIRNIFSGEISARKKHPNFYEEIQTLLREELVPLGFTERNGPNGRSRYVVYSQDEYSVTLTEDIMDSIYYVTAATSLNTEKQKKDFSIECTSMRQADEFKSNVIDKVNDWLGKQGVR